DLQAAAECGTVDGGHRRLAESLQRPQVTLDRLDGVECLPGVLGAEFDHALEIAAGEEGLLRTGDDHAGDRILLRDKAFDCLMHGLGVMLVHHVGRPGRVVHRQRDDAVGVLIPLNGVLCHGLKPSQTRSMMVATPMPPPMRNVISARRALRRSSSSTMVPVIMAPVAPRGWPIAMAPPLTLSFSSGM